MTAIVDDLKQTIRAASIRLQAYNDKKASQPTAPDKWSRKELLGHLIDSAANNHQRFVRAQFTDGVVLPGYEQNEWVACQQYQSADWIDLVGLWKNYNEHLTRVVAAIPEEKLGNRCQVGQNEPVTLEFLIADYLQHMKHHLGQIFG
ncbi:MAG: DinB family protein [Acidobacteria bacterium]|nr:DinB family protein [Acidobacteriota bacterium]